MASLFTRMLRAAQLDAALYEEVEADHGALWQATSVVVLSSLAAGIGSRGIGVSGGLLTMTVATLLGWYIWAYLTYFIGTRWLPGLRTEADWGQLLRTIGFSSAPGILRVIGVLLPGPAWVSVMFLLVATWMLIAMVIAVRQALDYESTARAVAVCAVGWGINLVISGVLLAFLSAPRPTLVPSLASLAIKPWVT
ncbi:MAG TPA: hypothetical protein VKK81_27030 [Candidatus Binatia bacterium]|nr:hypothetical protein [Candidatus Binatia bacterium]